MRLSKTFQVDQVGEDINIFVMLMFMLICCVPGFYIGYLSIDDTEQVRGWSAFLQTLGMLGGIFLAVIGMILGFIFWAFFEEYCRKRKGLPALLVKIP